MSLPVSPRTHLLDGVEYISMAFQHAAVGDALTEVIRDPIVETADPLSRRHELRRELHNGEFVGNPVLDIPRNLPEDFHALRRDIRERCNDARHGLPVYMAGTTLFLARKCQTASKVAVSVIWASQSSWLRRMGRSFGCFITT